MLTAFTTRRDLVSHLAAIGVEGPAADADGSGASTGGIISTPCGSGHAGYPTVRVGDRVRHGDIVGTVDDVIITTVGTVRVGIFADNGMRYFSRGVSLQQRD